MVQIMDKTMLDEWWQTVSNAVVGLSNIRSSSASKNSSHEFMDSAKPYAGHSCIVLDDPSKTIKAGKHGVSDGENMLVIDDDSLRYYTVIESSRLQTFLNGYQFHVSRTESMRQIRNAVPVKLTNIIGESVMKQMERMVTQYVERRQASLKAV